MKKNSLSNERGFVLVASLLAILILTAVGILVFTVTTQDIRVVAKVIGEKKAFAAAEAGIHRMLRDFDPFELKESKDVQVDPDVDPYTLFTIYKPTVQAVIPMEGYAIGGSQQWGQALYNTTVKGENTRYNSSVTIDVGIGFGPVSMQYR